MTKTDQTRLTRWRLKVLGHASASSRSVARTCRHFGISRPTFYKWKKRFDLDGAVGLCDRSRRPGRSPRATPTGVVSKILYLRQTYHFGPGKIAAYLKRHHQVGVARSSVHRILERHGLNRLPTSRKHQVHGTRWRRYEKAQPGHRVQIDVKFLERIPGMHKRSDEEKRDDRGDVDFSYVRYIGRQWFWAGVARFESNESMGLTLRSQLGGWAGRRLVNSNRARFEVGWGAVLNNENGVDTEPTQNVEGLIGFQGSYYTYDRPKTTLDASVDYFPGLSEWGRQRLQINAAVKRELWKDFFVGLNMFDTFYSEPPSPGANRNDVGVVIAIGWSY